MQECARHEEEGRRACVRAYVRAWRRRVHVVALR